jgi:RNA polymerase sigma factor (sigma-70 family)
MNWEHLIQKTADGDEAAFHEFYMGTACPVYHFILAMTKNGQEAEDIMQDTYLQVWMKAGTYVPYGKPLAWVFTIAKNLCYMRFRQQKQEVLLEQPEMEEREGEVFLPIEQATERALLLQALGELGNRERQIVLLYAASGLKHREVARALEIPLSTELSAYNRAMKKLQNLLKEQENPGKQAKS